MQFPPTSSWGPTSQKRPYHWTIVDNCTRHTQVYALAGDFAMTIDVESHPSWDGQRAEASIRADLQQRARKLRGTGQIPVFQINRFGTVAFTQAIVIITAGSTSTGVAEQEGFRHGSLYKITAVMHPVFQNPLMLLGVAGVMWTTLHFTR